MPRTNKTRQQLFDEKVYPDPISGCWLWGGGINAGGYGIFNAGNKCVLAHRFAWQAQRGEIPDGMAICHKCDVPSCVNVGHLWLGTNVDNNLDRDQKGRSRGGSMQGENHPQARITSEAVIDIRSKRLSRQEYAVKYGLAYKTIWEIDRHKKWKHITEQFRNRQMEKL